VLSFLGFGTLSFLVLGAKRRSASSQAGSIDVGFRLLGLDLDQLTPIYLKVALQLGNAGHLNHVGSVQCMSPAAAGGMPTLLHGSRLWPEMVSRQAINALTVKQGRFTYIGGLIAGAAKDEETQEWVIELDKKMRPLFAADQFTQIEWQVRHALNGQSLAQWLHGFYASHAKPFPMKVETLLDLSGSENTEPRSSRQKLRKALNALADTSEMFGEKFSYEIRGDLVHVDKQGKPANKP
jgi:hypothetical protein